MFTFFGTSPRDVRLFPFENMHVHCTGVTSDPHSPPKIVSSLGSHFEHNFISGALQDSKCSMELSNYGLYCSEDFAIFMSKIGKILFR